MFGSKWLKATPETKTQQRSIFKILKKIVSNLQLHLNMRERGHFQICKVLKNLSPMHSCSGSLTKDVLHQNEEINQERGRQRKQEGQDRQKAEEIQDLAKADPCSMRSWPTARENHEWGLQQFPSLQEMHLQKRLQACKTNLRQLVENLRLNQDRNMESWATE